MESHISASQSILRILFLDCQYISSATQKITKTQNKPFSIKTQLICQFQRSPQKQQNQSLLHKKKSFTFPSYLFSSHKFLYRLNYLYDILYYLYQQSKMYLNTRLQDHSFQVSVGTGHNDWAWLSHYVARKFSKIAYPEGNYLPTFLEIISKEGEAFYPHPKQKINIFLQENALKPEDLTINVRIRKPNTHLTQEEKYWQKDSFGLERYMMNVVYLLENNYEPNKPGNRDYYFKVVFDYVMHPEIRHIFSDRKYHQQIAMQLQEKAIGVKSCTFTGKIKIPFGSLKSELYCYRRDPQDPKSYRAQKIKDPKQKPDFKVSFNTSPKFFTSQEMNARVSEEMRISQNITKSLQQKQQEANKRNTNSSFCCFSFEELWKILEENHGNQLMLDDYDVSTKQRLKIILEKSLNSLYGVFFYYFIIEDQPKEKKEELGITYQHIMHFLRFYTIFPDLDGLQGFLQYYNSDFKFKSIEDTVDIRQRCIKFPQFVAILLRAIQFLQTSTFMVKGETFDVSVAKVIDRIIEIEGEEDEFSDFKKNLRLNPKIISFFAENSDALKKIYLNQALRSTQNSADNFVIMREQFKSMLEMSGLTHKSTDKTVDNLYRDLCLPDDGVFYYEFLEAIQWLALVTVNSQKDEDQLENDEEKQMILIEKIRFFMERVDS